MRNKALTSHDYGSCSIDPVVSRGIDPRAPSRARGAGPVWGGAGRSGGIAPPPPAALQPGSVIPVRPPDSEPRRLTLREKRGGDSPLSVLGGKPKGSGRTQEWRGLESSIRSPIKSADRRRPGRPWHDVCNCKMSCHKSKENAFFPGLSDSPERIVISGGNHAKRHREE